jgi:hypothetical protein
MSLARACLMTSVLLALGGCAAIAGLVDVPTLGDAQVPDGSNSDSSGSDSGSDAVAQSDSSDAAPLPDGWIQCAATSVQCNIAGGDECCLNVYGMIAVDGGRVYAMTIGSCEALGGANCGAYLGTGNNFDEQLPQTCSTRADCTGGASCCIALDDAGAVKDGIGITCQATCAAPYRTICRTNADCMTGTCKPETDPVLMHLYAKYCQ